jgi:N-acetylglutamate synthase-like GNAT family acetyltransferase
MMQIRNATDTDLHDVERLLKTSDLPVEGVAQNFANFLIAEDRGEVVGTIGLERFGSVALLRSAVIAPEHRGTGIGRGLVEALLSRAAEEGIGEVYLLTTTAEDYFPRFGFRRSTRSAVPDALKSSAEFQGACPETATVMARSIRKSAGADPRSDI